MARQRRSQFLKRGRAVRRRLGVLELQPVGQLDMHGLKRLPSVLDVKTDRIYHTVSASKCIGDRPLIVNVGCRPIEVADHQNQTISRPVPDVLMQSERKTRHCGDAEQRGGREIRFHRTR